MPKKKKFNVICEQGSQSRCAADTDHSKINKKKKKKKKKKKEK